MDDVVRQAEELRKQTQRIRYQFLLTELTVCFSALDFGEVELGLGEREVAVKELSAARKGMETILRFAVELDDGGERNHVGARLEELRMAANAFERKLSGDEQE